MSENKENTEDSLYENIEEEEANRSEPQAPEVDTEPVFAISEQVEPQSSCDTYMSEQSEEGDLFSQEPCQHLEEDQRKEESRAFESSQINSSLEVEANESFHNMSLPPLVLTESEQPDVNAGEPNSEGDIFEEKMNLDEGTSLQQETRKRKERSDESSPSPKRLCQESSFNTETPEGKRSLEVVYERSGKKDSSVPVLEISSTPEKTIFIEDSQDFSLRVEDTSPPSEDKAKESQVQGGVPNSENGSWKSHSNDKNSSTPGQGSLSQKSLSSWNSHGDKSLSWSSHSDSADKKLPKEEEECVPKDPQHSKLESPSLERNKLKQISGEDIGGENHQRVVTEERWACVTIHLTMEDNRVVSARVKQLSLLEEPVVDKPGRMSITSSASFKSSSSSGSVGLPGPFNLPSKSRLSVMSSVSTSTSGSSCSNSRPGWDGPFRHPMKPSPPGTLPALQCGHCHFAFPNVDQLPSTSLLNGSPLLKEEEFQNKHAKKVVSPLNEESDTDIKNCSRCNKPITKLRGRAHCASGCQKYFHAECTRLLNARKLGKLGIRRSLWLCDNCKPEDSPPKKSKVLSSSSSGQINEEETSSEAQPQAASTPTPNKKGRPKKLAVGSALPKTPQNDIATPSKPRVATPGHTPMPPRTKMNQSSDQVDRGGKEAVFAPWGDGHYYPGRALPWTDPATQVSVHFCDGKRKVMAGSRLVRAHIICAGTLVLAATGDSDEYEEALVVDIIKKETEPSYQVERDNVKRDVPFTKIALQEAQVMELTHSSTQKAAPVLNFNDLSLENIVNHPRKRSVRAPYVEMAKGPQVSSPSGRRRKRPTTPEPSTSNGQTGAGPDTYIDTDSSTHSTCSVDLRGKEVKPLDRESSPPEVGLASREKLSHYRRNRMLKTKQKTQRDEPEGVVKLMGPIPKPGSQLFAGCVFLITYTEKLSQEDIATSCVEETKEDEEQILVWKDRLRTQIKSGGGRVYAALNLVTKDELSNTYLLSDKPCNTPLYLQCVVHNIPIYSTSLIQKCCSQERSWKEVISQRNIKRLPSGYSLALKCMVNARTSQPLQDKIILLSLSLEPSLTEFWESLARKAGARVFRGSSLKECTFDVVVTDGGCESELVAQACKQSVPLVSVTWLQQCIVTGEFRPPTEVPAFKYNHMDAGGDSPEY